MLDPKCSKLDHKFLFEVSGGLRARLSESVPVVGPTPKEPVYITMAIGEGGGKLPDILS